MGSFLAHNDTQLEKMLYRLLGKYYSFGIHRMENTQNYRDAAEMTSYLKGPGKKKKKKNCQWVPKSSESCQWLISLICAHNTRSSLVCCLENFNSVTRFIANPETGTSAAPPLNFRQTVRHLSWPNLFALGHDGWLSTSGYVELVFMTSLILGHRRSVKSDFSRWPLSKKLQKGPWPWLCSSFSQYVNNGASSWTRIRTGILL